jgi:ribosomal-protein-alanine N-acetyltransferase
MRNPPIEISAVAPHHGAALAEFFERSYADGAHKFFHPHALTREVASERAAYVGEDLYYVMTRNSGIIGYGMLRGWDQGHEIPSLGILIHPEFRGIGLGGLFTKFLHVAAALRGAKEVFLHVDERNEVAIKLYRSLGYRIVRERDHAELVGRLSLIHEYQACASKF